MSEYEASVGMIEAVQGYSTTSDGQTFYDVHEECAIQAIKNLLEHLRNNPEDAREFADAFLAGEDAVFNYGNGGPGREPKVDKWRQWRLRRIES